MYTRTKLNEFANTIEPATSVKLRKMNKSRCNAFDSVPRFRTQKAIVVLSEKRKKRETKREENLKKLKKKKKNERITRKKNLQTV